MKKYSWSDGWHEINDFLSIWIENGKIIRGVYDGRTVYPYKVAKSGGYDNVSGIKANKRNFEKIVRWC